MNCTEIREFLPDLASGVHPISAESEVHLRECSTCSGELASLREALASGLRPLAGEK